MRARRGRLTALVLMVLVGAGVWKLRGAWLHRSGSSAILGSSRTGRTGPSVDPEEARLKAAVVRQPENPAAHAALGRYCLGLSRPASAVWELEEALDRHAADDDTLRADQAKALALIGQRDMAIAALRAALSPPAAQNRLARAQTEFKQQLADLLLTAGRPEAAIGLLRIPSGGKPTPALMLLIGRVEHALGHLGEAESALRRYAQIAPADTARFEPLGRLLLASGRAEDARQALMQDQRIAFQRADFHYLVGLTYARARPRPDLQKALGAFTVALHFNPRHPRALTALGDILEQQGDRERAIAEYEAAIDADPREPEPHTRLASLFMKMGQQEQGLEQRGIAATLEDRRPDALAAYRQMLAAAPGDLQASKAVILASISAKQIGKTQPVVDALRRRPFDPAEADLVSKLYLMTNALEPCRQLADAWHRQQPQSPASLRLLGRLAFDGLHVDEAIRLYQEAWERDSTNPETAVALGHAWARVPTRPHLEQARDWCQRGVALEPTNPKYHADLARIDQQLGETGPAVDEYLLAFDLDASLSSAAGSLAQLAQQTSKPGLAQLFGQIARALDDQTLAVDQAHHRLWDHPGNAEAEIALARLMVHAGELQMARAHLQQALKARPGDPRSTALRRTVEALLVWS